MKKEISEEQKALRALVKKGFIFFCTLVLVSFGGLFIWNFSTYTSLKRHSGYAVGRITGSWKQKGSFYCRYAYSIGDKTFEHVQGREFAVNDTVLIVYDTTSPDFSILAEYPLPLSVDGQNRIQFLDTSMVEFTWWDYLPGD